MAQHGKIGLHRLAVGERAGFVQRQPFQLAALLQIHAALHQNAFARGGGQPADNAHRGGNHQRTRAGNHQQHQRLIHPFAPCAV